MSDALSYKVPNTLKGWLRLKDRVGAANIGFIRADGTQMKIVGVANDGKKMSMSAIPGTPNEGLPCGSYTVGNIKHMFERWQKAGVAC